MKVTESIISADTELFALQGEGPDDLVRLHLINTGDGRVVLPVEVGQPRWYFSLVLRNLTGHMVGYPAYLARGERRLRNIFDATADASDPNGLPANGGFLEAAECGCEGYEYVDINGIKLQGNEVERFVINEELGFGGLGADGLDIFRRTLPGVTLGMLQGHTARREPSGPTIGTVEKTPDGRELTGLEYLQDATDPILRVRIVSRQQAAKMLTEAGQEVLRDWTCGWW